LSDLSIIIVNYRSSHLILDCLQTIYRETKKINFEIIIVDNDSKDDSKTKLEKAFPGVQWVQMNYNAGFARANNEGIKNSKGDIILLLNPDTLVESNAIDKCFERFLSSPYVACGVQLLNPDRSPQISGNYFMTGGMNCLLPLPYLGNFLGSLGKFFGVKSPSIPGATQMEEVDWINGAFLMVKKQSIKKAGLMDEDFFLYAEEAEWCYRLRKSGKICLFGEIHVIHLQGETANEIFGSPGKGYFNLYDRRGLQIMLSNFVRIRKQFGIFWFLFNLLVYTLEIPVFFVGVLLSNLLFGKKAKFSLSEFYRFTKNMATIWRLTNTIIRNKPHFYKVI
jgi:GT2 family glycosyltransferase